MSKSLKIICIIAGVCIVAIVLIISGLYIQKNLEKRAEEVDEKEEGVEEVIEKLVKEEEREVRYETLTDKDGNEIVLEMEKIIVEDKEGNEVEAWEDTVEHKRIYYYVYVGEIKKIENNIIYFNVDEEDKSMCEPSTKDVEDYEIVFDINTYDLESDPRVGYDVCDHLVVESGEPWSVGEHFYSADGLEFLVGEEVIVHDIMYEDAYTGEKYKMLFFCLEEKGV